MMLQPPGPKLRDIHVPPAAWWPPAPGWWILAALLVVVVLVLAWRWRVHRRRRAVRRALAVELHRVRENFRETGDHPRLAADLSQLLRRAVRLRTGQSRLQGDAWLAQLQQLAPGVIDAEQAVLLERTPYQPHADFDAESVLKSCEAWLHTALRGQHA